MKSGVLVLLGLVVSGTLAQAREYDPARFQAMNRKVEQLKCKKSPAYCEAKVALAQAQEELDKSNDYVVSLRRQAGRICENTPQRQLERSEADGQGLKGTISTKCSDIPDYVESAAPVLAEVSRQLRLKSELETQVTYLSQIVKVYEPVLSQREFSEAIAAANF